MGIAYILRDRVPVPCDDVSVYGPWYEKIENRWLADDREGSYRISTIFLCFDHNFSGEGPPLLFETALFREGRGLPVAVDRYATWDEAMAAHARAVADAKKRHAVETKRCLPTSGGSDG